MATRLDAFLLSIARDLNDAEPGYEFTRWTQTQLLDYLNEAISLALLFKPEYASATHILKLNQGMEQRACDCATLQRVIGQTDEYGNLLGGFLPRRASAVEYRWSKPPCPPPPGPFTLVGYSFEPGQGVEFTVTPPVPPNVDVYVKIECTDPPRKFTLADKASDIGYDQCQAALKEWVLWRALMVDDESSTSRAAAKDHFNAFWLMLRVQFSREMVKQLGLMSSAETKEILSTLRTAGLIGGQV